MKVIDNELLAEAFAKHAAACSSSNILCSVHVAFESWFRLELAHTLFAEFEGDIGFDYSYKGTRNKADLLFELNDRKVVFELKSFVSGADANKLDKFPSQLDLVKAAVAEGTIAQGIAFCTFIGYKTEKLDGLRKALFVTPWKTTGLRPILVDKPLRFMLAEIEGA